MAKWIKQDLRDLMSVVRFQVERPVAFEIERHKFKDIGERVKLLASCPISARDTKLRKVIEDLCRACSAAGQFDCAGRTTLRQPCLLAETVRNVGPCHAGNLNSAIA
jgi:hypothetical protein